VRLVRESAHIGHVLQALYHYNQALDQAIAASATITAKTLFDGMNKLQTAWLAENPEYEGHELAGFKAMASLVLDADAKSRVAGSDAVRALAALEPRVMSHDTLRKGGYRPGVAVPEDLLRDATYAHRKVANALERRSGTGAEEDSAVVKWAAELLYVVRSNIAHGEKTPFGPDRAKVARDEQVCRATVPLLTLVFDELLDRPGNRLVSYGTLAPGQPNSEVLSGLTGTWATCSFSGSIDLVDGLPAFWWDPQGSEIVAQVLVSSDLPSRWRSLDDFEGATYARRLIIIEVDGQTLAASAYLSRDEQPTCADAQPVVVVPAGEECVSGS
jgi:gamma-glutamylcyclotransferase (GGCT)/AIG2-like uncharacterized protein YtfP